MLTQAAGEVSRVAAADIQVAAVDFLAGAGITAEVAIMVAEAITEAEAITVGVVIGVAEDIGGRVSILVWDRPTTILTLIHMRRELAAITMHTAIGFPVRAQQRLHRTITDIKFRATIGRLST